MGATAEDLERQRLLGTLTGGEGGGGSTTTGEQPSGGGAGEHDDDEEDKRTPEQIREDERKLKDRLKELAPLEGLAGAAKDPDTLRKMQAAALGIEPGVRERVIEREVPAGGGAAAPAEDDLDPKVWNKRIFDAALNGTAGEVIAEYNQKMIDRGLRKAAASAPDYGPQLASVRLESFEGKLRTDPETAGLYKAAAPFWGRIKSGFKAEQLARMSPDEADAALGAAFDMAVGQAIKFANKNAAANGSLTPRRADTEPPQMGGRSRGGAGTGGGARKSKTKIEDIPPENVRIGRSAGLTDGEIIEAWDTQREEDEL